MYKTNPIKIFIGTSPGTDDKKAEKVLEYSLRKNSSKPLDIIYMRNNSDPSNFFGGFDSSPWWTPFSYLRWAIPEYCDFKGKAIYMDVDQVNFRDIVEFFNMDMQGKAVAVREKDFRSCVMLMDCEKLKSLVPSVSELKVHPPETQADLVSKVIQNSTTYDRRWNCLDGEGLHAYDIWHLHFTEMTTQPWAPNWAFSTWEKKGKVFKPEKHSRHDLVYIWNTLLKEADNA